MPFGLVVFMKVEYMHALAKFVQTRTTLGFAAISSVLTASACAQSPAALPVPNKATPTTITLASADVIISAPQTVARPPFTFSDQDADFLTQVQHGSFNFLWNAGNPATGMVPDRSSITTVSVAGVGFQLSAFPVGVARGWITKEQALERTKLILDVLERDPSIRHAGLFQHYLDGATGGPHTSDLEHVVSTIDSALLHAGLLTISSYLRTPDFTNDKSSAEAASKVADQADRIFAEANWRAFLSGDWANSPHERGFISLGWKPSKNANGSINYASQGELLPYFWIDSGCEHRLVTFLGVCAPTESHRLDPALYYKLRRALGVNIDPKTNEVSKPMVYFPFGGALFVNQFSHVWLNYAKLGPDNPKDFGMIHRASVDWWENSRRLTQMQIDKCRANPLNLPTFGENAWGVTASDAASGYSVPGLFPTPVTMRGTTSEFDYSTFHADDNFGDGTVAPYGAGSAILFEPKAAVAALRHYRELASSGKLPALWNDPAKGGYGFQDSFNLAATTKDGTKAPWVAPDVVAIDAGPLILMIENARTGLVQDLFMAHPYVKSGLARLKLNQSPTESLINKDATK